MRSRGREVLVKELVLVGLGGALGSCARHLVQRFANPAAASGFPWGTFAVNVVGSLALGALVAASAVEGRVQPSTRLFLATGVLGGFTTYSAFNQEVLGRFTRGEHVSACVYVLATLVTCFAAGWIGMQAARAVL